MLISEIFYSIQGEGILTGVPSIFIRTSGCNLRCRWCDTPYASWKPKGFNLNMDEILARLEQWPAAKHVVITGGEPMIARGIHALAQELRVRGYHITIETAGTIAPGGITCNLASLSPKLSHSTPLPGEIASGWIERHEQLRLQPNILRAWLDHCTDYQLKFVVGQESDLCEIIRLLSNIGTEIPAHRVLLMPEGKTIKELRSRSVWLSDVCLNTGYRFCHRLHVELYGNKRGT